MWVECEWSRRVISAQVGYWDIPPLIGGRAPKADLSAPAPSLLSRRKRAVSVGAALVETAHSTVTDLARFRG